MYPSNSQFSVRADGMPEAMPPSVFERNNPTPKATPKATPTFTPVVPSMPRGAIGPGGSIPGGKGSMGPGGSSSSNNRPKAQIGPIIGRGYNGGRSTFGR